MPKPNFKYYVEEHDYEYVVFVDGFGSLVAFPTEEEAQEFVKTEADSVMERRAKYPDYGF